MKIYLKFDHTKNSSLEAIGSEVNKKEMDKQIKNVLHKLNDDDAVQKTSQLAELIHNDIDYEVILFLATKSIEELILKIKVEELKDKLKDFLDERF